MSNRTIYDQVFAFLSSASIPTAAESALVFGRSDPLVAHAAGNLAAQGLVDFLVITGGIGKDSAGVVQAGYSSEAAFIGHELAVYADWHNFTLPPTKLEEKAMNGRENVTLGLRTFQKQEWPINPIVAVCHATSAARLAATLKHELRNIVNEPLVHIQPSTYAFDSANPHDQHEATKELLRLIDWPEKGHLDPIAIPANLVDFATDSGLATPLYPSSRLLDNAFRLLPPRLRIAALHLIN